MNRFSTFLALLAFAAAGAFTPTAANAADLSLPVLVVTECDAVCVPVYVTSFSGIAGVELHFTYDETCMIFDSVSLGYLGGATVNGGGGSVHVIWEDFMNPLSLADGDSLTFLCFGGITATPDAPCPLAFLGNCELVDEFGDPLPLTTEDGSLACDDGCCRMRGDVNHDGAELIDIADLLYLIDYMFRGGPEPVCFDEADIDASGLEPLDISDLFYLIDYMFTGGPEPLPCP